MKNFYTIVFLIFALPVFSQQKFEVFFDFNKDFPNQVSIEKLQNWIGLNKDATVSVLSGFCDSIDSNSYNVKLSAKRIESVLQILKENNISISKTVEIKPMGENFKRSEKQSENRKVEIVYQTVKAAIPVAKKPTSKSEKSARKAEAEEISEPETADIPLEQKFEKAKKGDIIRIENIKFQLDSEEVVKESEPILTELYQVLEENTGLKIEIHGHICCNPDTQDTKLSYRRAKFIFTFLRKKGIGLNRLSFKGFGSSRPIYKIPERTIKEERANRRVEILVTENKK